MTDPFGAWSSGGVQVACQVVHLEGPVDGTVIDLVMLEPWRNGIEHLPAGTPLAIRFGTGAVVEDSRRLRAIMARWEQLCAVVTFTVEQAPGGLECRFSSGDLDLVVTVEAPRGPE